VTGSYQRFSFAGASRGKNGDAFKLCSMFGIKAMQECAFVVGKDLTCFFPHCTPSVFPSGGRPI